MADPSICLWYISNEPEYLKISMNIMSNTKVSKILVMKTQAFSWGNGFDKSVEDGGLDEIAARNYAIEGAENTGCDWLLQCDSDEFYTPETIELFIEAERQGKDSIRMSRYQFQEPNRIAPGVNPKVEIDGCLFNDPHVVAWKTSTRTRFQANTHAPLMDQYANKTLHCNPAGFTNTLNIRGDEIFHVEFSKMIGAKAPARRVPIEQTNGYFPNKRIIPEFMEKIWRQEQ